MLGLQHNAGSHAVQRDVMSAGQRLNKSLRHMSSGERVSSAADNAAGVAVKANLRASLISRHQSLRNAHEGVNMLQVAESGIAALSELFSRARELSVQAANDSLSKRERTHLDIEFRDIIEQVDDVFKRTEYNGRKLLDDGSGSYNPEVLRFQVGVGGSSDDQISLTMKFGLVKTRFTNADNAGSLSLRMQSHAQVNIDLFDRQIVELDRNRTRLGSAINRLKGAAEQAVDGVHNTAYSLSQLADTDMGRVASEVTSEQIRQNAGISLLSQANAGSSAVLRLLG